LKFLDGTLPESDGEYELADLIAPGGLAERFVYSHWPHYRLRYCGSLEDLFQEAKLALVVWVREQRLDPKIVAVSPKLINYLKQSLRAVVKKFPIQSGLVLVRDDDGAERALTELMADSHPQLIEDKSRLEKLDEAARTFWRKYRGKQADFSGNSAIVLAALRKGKTVAEIAHQFDWPVSKAREEVTKVIERVKASLAPHGDELARYYLHQKEPVNGPRATAESP